MKRRDYHSMNALTHATVDAYTNTSTTDGGDTAQGGGGGIKIRAGDD